jgi:hypothetical protein
LTPGTRYLEQYLDDLFESFETIYRFRPLQVAVAEAVVEH